MIDLSDIVNDPDLAQAYTIIRSTGAFVQGGYQTVPTTVAGYGPVTRASEQQLKMIPAADRVDGAMVFHSTTPLYITKQGGGFGSGGFGKPGFGTSTQRVSDIIIWHGSQYRLMNLLPYSDYGFWRAIGVRMAGN